MNLAGKTALVTGGGSGIGLASAVALADAGCRVAICGRREEVLRAAIEQHPRNPPLACHVVDVADRESTRRLFAWAEGTLGRVDILVNAAGVNIKTRTMADMAPEQWDYVLGVNATGVYNCVYFALPGMKARRDGLIINISSVSGKRATALGGVAYCASKFAATALGVAVANEVGADGVRVTNVYPGEVNTPILEFRPKPVSDEHKAAILQPEDVGALVAALAALPPRAHVPEVIVKPTWQAYS